MNFSVEVKLELRSPKVVEVGHVYLDKAGI